MSFETICRVCTKKSEQLASIFDYYIFSKECLQIFKVITDCASVQIQSTDGFSKKICHQCIHHLSQAYSFKKLCEDSDYKFRNNLIEEEVKVHCDDNKINDAADDNLDTPEYVEFTEIKIEETEIQYGASDNQLPIAETWNLTQESTSAQHLPENPPSNEEILLCENLEEKSYNDEQLSSNFLLVKHKRKHTDFTPFQCSTCLKYFKNKETLKSHSLVHKESELFKCDICDSPFRVKATLYRHMKKVHGVDKLFKCSVCSKPFTSYPRLNRHKKLHEKD